MLVCSLPTARAASDSMLSQFAQARDYVFSACLIEGYRGSSIAAEAEVWAGGLVERGNLSGDLYPKLAQLVQSLTPPAQTSKNGTPMIMQSCIALYNSPALQKKIAHILSR